MSYKKWTKEEIEYLKNNYQIKTDKDIALYLNLTSVQIEKQRRKLGLKKGWNYTKVKEIVEEQNYILLSTDYKNSADFLEMMCPEGHYISIRWNDFYNKGVRCSKCYGNYKLDFEYVFNFVENIGYTLLSDEYINSKENLSVCCNKGHIFDISYSNLQSGQRCSECYGNKAKTTDIFKSEVFNLVGNEYNILSEYINAFTHIQFKHNKCNYIFPMTPHNFLRGQRCPECAESKGEKQIKIYFNFISINYIWQKEFEGLVGLGNGNLSYDFYLPQYNLLIEYQGEQHEKYIPGFHKSYNNFEKQLEHDHRKREYAKNHNIKLLEIWYYDFNNIEKILEKYLSM